MNSFPCKLYWWWFGGQVQYVIVRNERPSLILDLFQPNFTNYVYPLAILIPERYLYHLPVWKFGLQ